MTVWVDDKTHCHAHDNGQSIIDTHFEMAPEEDKADYRILQLESSHLLLVQEWI